MQIEDPQNDVFLSAASAWEISIKYALRKLKLPEVPELLVPAMRRSLEIEPLAIDEEATLAVRRLPALHRDPFDRLLICQAIVQGLTIVTPDPLIRQYPVRTTW